VLAALWSALPWWAGVDVFFVISGFVIVHASAPLFGTPGGPARFLGRRLGRVVPLYWAATTLFLLVSHAAPGAVHGADGGPGYVLRSYLFIPARRPDGLVEPVFGLGWTLDFEMLFYVVLAPLLRLPRALAVAAATGLLGGLVAAGAAGLVGGVVWGTWASPIVGEFCAGMLVALGAERARLGRPARAALVVLAVAILAAAPAAWPRPLAAGGPAVLLLLAAISGGGASAHPGFERVGLERVGERWGDASYALYLSHPFVMRPATLVWRHLWPHLGRGGDAASLLCAAVELAAAQAVALLLHRRVERPLARRIRRAGTLP
jgi:exopolysaccharide production protein ExoZ